MKKPVYLDYHSTTPCDPAVIDAMMPCFGAGFGNPGAKSHAHGRNAARQLEQAVEKIGRLIGAGAECITLTSGATESNNLALLGLAERATDRKEIVITAIEHNCVSNTAAYLATKGFTVKIVPVDADGVVRLDALKTLVTPQTLVVSVITASHEIGTIQPLKECAGIARAAGALFHTDATQALGKIAFDVNDIQADLVSYSAHKIYGPVGIGALYVRQKPPVAITRVFFGGAQQSLRPGSVPLALAVGFGAACDIAAQGLTTHIPHMQKMTALLLAELQARIPALKLNGGGQRLPGLLNIRLPEVSAQDIMLELADDLCMSTGAACSSANRKPSPVLKAIGLSDTDIDCSLRLTVGRQSTAEEMNYAASVLADGVQPLSRRAA
ncbi:MAG: cysteine desulfurase [Alphaproteobacteria bacterium]|nr:cysteine desulfurase [Alphaproteobacteria bacterium]